MKTAAVLSLIQIVKILKGAVYTLYILYCTNNKIYNVIMYRNSELRYMYIFFLLFEKSERIQDPAEQKGEK